MYSLFRSLLFRLDPESAHGLTLRLIRLSGQIPPVEWLLRYQFAAPPSPRNLFGLSFSNSVGLAAGYDKDGLGWRGLACLGFGHIEVGTVTLKPQPGNPPPRLFRLVQDRALINRMGFPGRGADFVARQLGGKRPPGLVLGVNLGKNKTTSLEDAPQEYQALVEIFASLADYLAINVSSPNTVGLRRLQSRQMLADLLRSIAETRTMLAGQMKRNVPILVKLAPDLTDPELEDALEVIIQHGMDGVIATNTTLSREGLSSGFANETGGLSGAPLGRRSLEMVKKILVITNGTLPVIGVGGITSAQDARKHLDAGASLIQVYTGLVYAGPGLVKEILSSVS